MINLEKYLNKDKINTLGKCIVDGYKLANYLITEYNNRFDNIPLIFDHKSNLIRLAVDYQLYKSCKNNIIPFNAEILPNKKGNCKHIELNNGNLIITTNKTRNYKIIPRTCIFREELAYTNNQPDLFEPTLVIKDNSEKIYVCLTHGCNIKQTTILPTFITMGIPKYNLEDWIFRINLLNADYFNENKFKDEFKVDEPIIKFKEFVEDIKVKKA